MIQRRIAGDAPPVSFALPSRAARSGGWFVLLGWWLAMGAAMAPPADAITISMEYTDEGDPEPHDENPSWDPGGIILKQHFAAAKAIWESLLPGPGIYEFDFHWDDDISGLGLTTSAEPFDTFIEINPTAQWYIDPTPTDNKEYSFATAQTLYGGLSAQQKQTYFPGSAPPDALEVGYWATGQSGFANVTGQPSVTAQTGLDLLSTVVHEIGHVLGISEIEPGEYNIAPIHVGGITNVLVKEGDGGHLAGMGEIQFLMCESCGVAGFRRIPTATDVLVIAEDQGINDVSLRRVGRISSGLWSDSGAWIGGDAPGFPQDAYITHGGTVTLDANSSAKDLLVAGGNSVVVGGNSLNLGGNLAINAGATVSVGTGGTISAQDIIRGSNDITTAPGSLVWFNNYSGGGGPAANFNGSIRIGNNGNTSPPTTFNPDAINAWTIGQEMAIDSGNGPINVVIDNDADFTSASGRIGPANGVGVAPNVTINGAAASWDVNGPLAVPLGNVTVTNNGYLEADSATVGSALGRSAVTVETGNSRWKVQNNLEVGPPVLAGDGQGLVTIRNTGRLLVDGNLNIHGTSTRTSEVSIQTDGDLEVDGAINVGPYGLLVYRDETFGYSGVLGSQTTNNFGGAGNEVGGITRFAGNSIANRNLTPGTSEFTNHPGTTLFGGAGSTEFRDSASAGSAEFNNLPGGTVSRYSGTTRFFDFATAANGQFFNQPGRWTIPPTVEFNGDSTGGNGTFVNLPGVLGVSQGGAFVFNDRARAGTGTYATQGEAGYVVFNDFSSAENGTFTTVDAISSGNSRIEFHEDSKAGTATFDMRAGSVLSFITRSSAEDATITLRTASTAGFGGEYNVPRLPTVTAGTAEISVLGASVAHAYGGRVGFSTYSTAGDAVINTYGGTVAAGLGGTTRFDYEGRAGNATLITHGPGVPGAGAGQTEFARGANGDTAKVITHAGGVLTIAGNRFSPVTTFGSIEGAGIYELSGAEMQTGSRNTDTTVSGQIVDVPSSSLGGRLIKVGTGTLTLAGANTYTGLTTINGGAVNVAGSLAGGVVVNNGGTIAGAGNIAGAVTVNAGGTLAPGASPGTLTVGGLSLSDGSLSRFELGAPSSDRITASGAITLDGTLNISLFGSFMPAPGQSFTLFESTGGAISGMFDAINTPAGLDFDVVQNSGSLVLQFAGPALTADFDEDGDVDGDDLTRWRNNFGAGTTHLQGDADGDSDSDGADFLAWQRQLGSGPAVPVAGTVPEPATFSLLLAGLAAIARRRKRRDF